ncbi:MAG: cysG [Firmicutes bacterium]|nr:cysG [Bacillota bacterium]
MAYYPINLRISGRRCLVIGGGEVAERKVTALLAAEAIVTLCSPMLTPLLLDFSKSGKITYINTAYAAGLAKNYFIVICATSDSTVNTLAAQEARDAGALVNVVDAPDLCDFTVPAQVVNGDLVLTVSTGGKSPALASWMRKDLAKHYGPEYGLYLDMISRLRQEIKERLVSSAERQVVWREALDEEVFCLLAAGRMDEAEEKIRNAAGCIGVES